MIDPMPAPLNDDQRRALAPVLDGFIPASDDGRLPAAGELGVAADLDQVLQRYSELHAQVVTSLAALDRLARGRGAARFTALSPEQQTEVMTELSCSHDAFP